MNDIYEFFAMGGYAFYVWWSYGIAAFVLLFNVFYARHQAKHIHRQIQHTSINRKELS